MPITTLVSLCLSLSSPPTECGRCHQSRKKGKKKKKKRKKGRGSLEMFQVHPLLRPRSAGGHWVDVIDVAGRPLLKCKGTMAIHSAVGLQDIHHSGYEMCSFVRAATTKSHKLGGFGDRSVLSQSWRLQVQDQGWGHPLSGVNENVPCASLNSGRLRAP